MLLAVFMILGLLTDILHPFYLSLTEIKYKPEESALHIAQKIFWDDLEYALKEETGLKIDFLNSTKNIHLDRVIEKYLLTHNEIRVNGKQVNIKYLGYEIEDDAAWFYLEANNINKPYEIQIKNTILLDHFPSQKNIVHVYIGTSSKSFVSKAGQTRKTLSF